MGRYAISWEGRRGAVRHGASRVIHAGAALRCPACPWHADRRLAAVAARNSVRPVSPAHGVPTRAPRRAIWAPSNNRREYSAVAVPRLSRAGSVRRKAFAGRADRGVRLRQDSAESQGDRGFRPRLTDNARHISRSRHLPHPTVPHAFHPALKAIGH
jgi:hypothetical protein